VVITQGLADSQDIFLMTSGFTYVSGQRASSISSCVTSRSECRQVAQYVEAFGVRHTRFPRATSSGHDIEPEGMELSSFWRGPLRFSPKASAPGTNNLLESTILT